MSQEPLPKIDGARCTGCGLCIAICPTQALVIADGNAALGDDAQCTYCIACEEICPAQAIALPFLIVMAKRNDAYKPSKHLHDG